MESMKYFVAGLLAPLFWVLVIAIPLFLVRRYFPRAEKYLFGSVTYGLGWITGRTLGLLRRATRRQASSVVRPSRPK